MSLDDVDSVFYSCAPGWTRTSDLLFRKQVLYPLSYGGSCHLSYCHVADLALAMDEVRLEDSGKSA